LGMEMYTRAGIYTNSLPAGIPANP
jgi:hypothetical protein